MGGDAGESALLVGVGGSGVTHELVARASDGAHWLGPHDDLPDDDLPLAIDDAHEFSDEMLDALTRRVTAGTPALIGHRPSDRPGLAALDAAIERGGGEVVAVGRRSLDDLGVVLATAAGSAIDSDLLAEIHAGSGGLPRLALARLADDGRLELAIDRELTLVSPGARRMAELAALGPDLPLADVARAAGLSVADTPAATAELHHAGLQDEQTATPWPLVAEVVRRGLGAAGRAAGHEALASALAERNGPPDQIADHLLRAGSTGADTVDVFTRAGEALVATDPEAALAWYDEADAVGGSTRTAIGRAEATLRLGGEPQFDRDAAGDGVAVALRAVVESRALQPARAERLLGHLGTDDGPTHPAVTRAAGRRLAALVAVCGPGGAPPTDPIDPFDDIADAADRLLAALEIHARGDAAGAAFSDALTAVERLDNTFVWPDSPHVIAALALAAAGDHGAAALVLDRAERCDPGHGLETPRRLLVSAWVAMRAARYEPAAKLAADPPPRRDRRDELVAASLAAGLARRSGDIARLRTAWADAEPLLLGAPTDRLHVDVTGELIAAAARLGHAERAAPARDGLASAVGDQPGWALPHAWNEVSLAIEAEDPTAAARARARIGELPGGGNHQALLLEAADAWTVLLEAVAGGESIDAAGIERTALELAGCGMAWDASRLAGQAAIRADDPTVARRLLEQARELHRQADTASAGAAEIGLSDREVEIARFVVDGLTYKEIGAQLYIAPKTVEHHVARIRRKVQAGSRAEMIAALREVVTTP